MEILTQLKNVIKKNYLRKFFKNTSRIIEHENDMDIIISCLFSDLSKFLDNIECKIEEWLYDVYNIKEFDIGNLWANIENRNRFLARLVNIFKENGGFFYLGIINGSIATNDYKPGWSDVDLFVMINEEVVLCAEKLKELKRLVFNIEKQIYKYNILQLHGLFISTEIDKKFHLNSFFPSECMKYGKVIDSKEAKVKFHVPWQALDNYKYFYNDIYLSSFNLLRKRRFSYWDKILLLHRIFSFPFSFLQCVGIYTYKKHSYECISQNYNALFPGISDFYKEVNKFYYSWKINSLRTLKIRSVLLDSVYTPYRINKIFLRFEKEILDNLNKGFAKFIYPNLQIYANFLCNAREYLNKYLPIQIIRSIENKDII